MQLHLTGPLHLRQLNSQRQRSICTGGVWGLQMSERNSAPALSTTAHSLRSRQRHVSFAPVQRFQPPKPVRALHAQVSSSIIVVNPHTSGSSSTAITQWRLVRLVESVRCNEDTLYCKDLLLYIHDLLLKVHGIMHIHVVTPQLPLYSYQHNIHCQQVRRYLTTTQNTNTT